jgi:expansin (peptidoglycan-binding protein)
MTHFDLSPEAFSTIANTAAGVIYTSFRQVACPVSVPILHLQSPQTLQRMLMQR